MTALRAVEEQMTGSILLHGEEVCLDPRGAIYLPRHGLLAVSDLHLEKGSAFARRGRLLPPYDTEATLDRLAEAISVWRPRAVVSLGDSFHDGWGAERLPPGARLRLEAMVSGRQWFWIAGNHDPEPPAGLPGDCVAELTVGGLVFRHEPGGGKMEGEVAGHLHPGARVHLKGRSVRRRCFATDGARLVMPAFGAFTGSLNVLDRALWPLFEATRFSAYLLGPERVYRITRPMLVGG